MKEKVVLAYSGGLDTTALIPWLKETFDYEVICCCVNCGQGNELDGLDERAKMSGASKLYIEDIVDDSATNISCPAYRQAPFMNTNTFSEPLWPALLSRKSWWRSPVKRTL